MEEIGDVVIVRQNGSKAVIISVLFVLEMKCNLLNIGQLVQKGFTVVVGHYDHIEVFDANKKLILRSKLSKNKTFQVNLEAVDVRCLAIVENNEESWLWHSRYKFQELTTTRL